MKKFITIIITLIGMINVNAQDPYAARMLHVGTYQIGAFDAPDEWHSGTVINTRRDLGINNSTRVKLVMVVYYVSGDTVKGYIDYVVPCPGLVFANRAFYQPGTQRVVFTAIREGTSYNFDFRGKLKFFTKGQNYDFDVFDGQYTTSENLFTSSTGKEYTILVLEQSTGTNGISSTQRNAKIELDTIRDYNQ